MCFYCFQKQCIDFTINAQPLSKFMPSNKRSIKYTVWRIVVSQPFDYFIMIMIVINTIILMMKVRPSCYLLPKVASTSLVTIQSLIGILMMI